MMDGGFWLENVEASGLNSNFNRMKMEEIKSSFD